MVGHSVPEASLLIPSSMSYPLGARRSLGRKFLIAAASLALALLVVELVLRTELFATGQRYSIWRTERRMQDIAAAMSQHVGTPDAQGSGVGENLEGVSWVLHPYLGVEQEQANRHSHQEAERLRKTRSENTYDIAIVGGSVAGIFWRDGKERLADLLKKDARFQGREIRFANQGRGGFKQPQQTNFVHYLLSLGYKPDAVINIDGFNECALANFNARNGTHPIYPSRPHWAFLITGATPDRQALDLLLRMRQQQLRASGLSDLVQSLDLHYSAILGKLSLSRMQAIQREYVAAYDQYSQLAPGFSADRVMAGPDLPTGFKESMPDSTVNEIARIWEEGSVSLSGICASRSIHYLHVLQPTLYDQGSKPLTESEIKTGAAIPEWVEGVRHGYPRLRTAGEHLRSRGVNFLDCSMVFQDVAQDLYFDACHFNPAGNHILAEAIAKAFLESLPP
jgi:hypothetical protein